MSQLENLLADVLAAHADDAGDGGPLLDGVKRREQRRRRNRAGVAALVTVAVALAGVLTVTQLRAAPAPPPSLPAQDLPDQRDGAPALTRGHWNTLPLSPSGPRVGPVLAWDGAELLQVGGTGSGPPTQTAAFDPATGRWRTLAPAPFSVASEPRDGSVALGLWTGRALFVLTRTGAALFDPATNTWTTAPAPPLDVSLSATMVWTGRKVLVGTEPVPSLAGSTTNIPVLRVAGYDPLSNTWTRLDPPAAAGHTPIALTMVAVREEVVLWSLWSNDQSSGVDVFRLDARERWHEVTGAWPQHQAFPPPVFTGQAIVIPPGSPWCGACSYPAPYNSNGYLADPQTLALTPMPHGPLDDLHGQLIWTGRALVAVRASGSQSDGTTTLGPQSLAVWDPAANHWTLGPDAPRELDYRTPALWGHHHLFAIDSIGYPVTFSAS